MATTPSNLGYWILDAYTGAVSAYGDANSYGDRTASNTGGADLWPISIALVPTSDGKGYWILDVGLSGLGSVRAYGDAISYGDQTDVAGITGINGRPVDMAATPDGKGYWIVDSDGGGSSPSAMPPSPGRWAVDRWPPTWSGWPAMQPAADTGWRGPTAECSPSAERRSSDRWPGDRWPNPSSPSAPRH
jgi:hypothetical protein